MIIRLADVLNTAQRDELQQFLATGTFEAGELTAGWHARGVKQNEQWHASPEHMQMLNDWLTARLAAHPAFAGASYAKYTAPFICSRSQHGGHYGDHIDDALMGADQLVRSDLSCTLFLSDPDSYEGGDLVMDFGGETLRFRLPAGHAILYPSTPCIGWNR